MSLLSWKFLGSALLLAALSGVQVGRCARILGVFPITSVSHQVVYRAVMTELARRGHELVVITPDPINDPSLANYTEIDVSFMYEGFRKAFDFAGRRLGDESVYSLIEALVGYGAQWCEEMLAHGPVQKLISQNNTDEHFDLVFVEWLSTYSAYGFAHRFSAPLIGIASLPLFAFGHDAVGNPTNPAYVPQTFFPYSDRMAFHERARNFAYSILTRRLFHDRWLPQHQAIADRHFGYPLPSLGEMHKNVSMLFVNFEPSFQPPRPEVPAVVHIPGLHLNPPKPLPQDIQQYLDSAPKGVVYFSLGSNVRSDKLDSNIRQMFLDAFAELDDGYRVLWKFESEGLTGLPANVKVQKWLPQQDILRHPNVKAFITQGGLQSADEAIHSGVPLIGIPFFADQDYNVARIVDKGVGVKLDISEVTKEKILHALNTVLHDKSYQDNVKRLSAMMRDQPTSPLERAVWWTEYVLRHKGAAHLRTAAVDMPWYQYLLLDVVAFLLATALVIILLLWRIAKFLYSRLRTLGSRKLKKN